MRNSTPFSKNYIRSTCDLFPGYRLLEIFLTGPTCGIRHLGTRCRPGLHGCSRRPDLHNYSFRRPGLHGYSLRHVRRYDSTCLRGSKAPCTRDIHGIADHNSRADSNTRTNNNRADSNTRANNNTRNSTAHRNIRRRALPVPPRILRAKNL